MARALVKCKMLPFNYTVWHTPQSWRSLCVWPNGCQRDQLVAVLLHLSELPVAEVSVCSKQAWSLTRVLLCELILQGEKCSLSVLFWDQFPQLNPFHGDMAIHLHEDSLPAHQFLVCKTWAIFLLLLWCPLSFLIHQVWIRVLLSFVRSVAVWMKAVHKGENCERAELSAGLLLLTVCCCAVGIDWML